MKETNDQAYNQHAARTHVHRQKNRCEHSQNANRQERSIAGRPREHRRGKPKALRSKDARHLSEVAFRGEDSTRADEASDLECERIKRGEKNQPKASQE